MQDLEGKTVVVTGAASGMGYAFAECFGREGMNVVMADVEAKALRKAAAQIEAVGATVLPVVTDVGDEASMDHLGEATRKAFGSPDIVCLNAGVAGGGGPMETLTTRDWKWTLDVNLWGVIHGIRVFLGELKERDSGHFVVTASVAGLTSYPWLGPYNTTKHAAVTICETLHAELREVSSGVRVSCLCPGAVATQIGTSERNRPKELRNREAAEPGQVSQADFGDFEKIARAPAEIAELVLAAVLEDRFWIETDDYYREPIKARHRAIENFEEPPARGLILSPYTERQ
jgi:NAD(P)-dependent dehydrogenase (short-subunit alcohol dehydrogenase family)